MSNDFTQIGTWRRQQKIDDARRAAQRAYDFRSKLDDPDARVDQECSVFWDGLAEVIEILDRL